MSEAESLLAGSQTDTDTGGNGNDSDDPSLLGSNSSGKDTSGKDGADDGTGDDTDGGEDGDESSDEGAPEKYEAFTMPEGIEPDQAMLDKFEPLAKELNLNQEQAQKMIDLYNDNAVKANTEMQEAWTGTVEGWMTELKEDADFGGTHFDENVDIARKAMDKFGSPELRVALNETGMGNHPELVKFACRIGKLISEDKFLGGDGTPDGGKEKTAAEKLYPNHN